MWTALKPDTSAARLAATLRSEVFLDTLGLDPERPELNQGGLPFAWYEEGELAGSMVLERPDPSTVVFSRIAVKPALRGQGIGQAMLFAAQDWSRSKGCKKVVLFAHRGSRAFYERYGYQAMGAELILENIPHQRMELQLKTISPLRQ